jgi:RecA/RadA recombinase
MSELVRVPSKKNIIDQIKESAELPPQQISSEISWRKTISSGSLLLDLAISGGRTKYGGFPGGIVVEIIGPASTGKTTILAETVGNAQRNGGEVIFDDTESRLDPGYCVLMGIKYDPKDMCCSKTVTEVFERLIGPLEKKGTTVQRNWNKAWRPDPNNINVYAIDSLAALSTLMEMEQGDKMGQRRAKEFSEGFRLTCAHIKDHNILMLCSNQLRSTMNQFGEEKDSPGGEAIKYYSSIRIRLKMKEKLYKEVEYGRSKERHIYGIDVEAQVVKSSIDAPYRKAPIRMIFNHGIDDIGANLIWLKSHEMEINDKGEMGPATAYVVGDKRFITLDRAIKYVEDNNLESEVRERVVDLWHKMEDEIRPNRKAKVRF